MEARPEVDRINNRVAVVLQADPSRRAYVRKINLAGNNRSRDIVVRRELRQFEASWYDGYKIKLSRDRVDRLGYFGDVSVETSEVPGSPDQVDLTLNLVEKPTGSLSLGAGFSSGDGLGLQLGMKQDNAFGSGNSLGVQLNTSKINRVLDFSTTDPYFTSDGVSRTLSAYHKIFSPYQDQSYYQLVTSGGSIRFGVPFTESDTVYFGAGIENTTIVPGTSLPTAYLDYAKQFGYESSALPLTLGWSRDRRDSSLAPTSGRYQRLSADLSVAGDARYFRSTLQHQEYFPLSKQLTLALNADLGFGAAVGERSFPVFKNFYGGGLGSVRGFEQGSLGPKDISGTVVGGTQKLNVNAELLAPFPGVGNDKTLRMYGFLDAGSVGGPGYGLSVNDNASDLRSSAGVGLSWISPVGPLRLAFAWPVKKFEGDKMQSVQFQIGSSF